MLDGKQGRTGSPQLALAWGMCALSCDEDARAAAAERSLPEGERCRG